MKNPFSNLDSSEQLQLNEKKIEEEIKNNMKRKWDNFAKTHASKVDQINEQNSKQNLNLPEDKYNSYINFNNQNIQKNTNNKNTNSLDLNPIKEVISKEKKEIIPSLISKKENDNKDRNEIRVENLSQTNLNNEENNKEGDIKDNNVNKNNDNTNIKNEISDNKKEEEDKTSGKKKDLDYENKTIEIVFHITLDKENPKKYLYLEFYLSKLLSMGQPLFLN